MSLSIDVMLEEISKEGFTSDEIKGAVKQFLEPYFKNKLILEKNALQSHFLSMFSYIVVYYSDESFSRNLLEIIDCYRKAYLINPVQVKKIIYSTVNLMGQKENLMWTVKSITPNNVPDDIHEATYTYMKHIGDSLEIGLKHEIIELYAILEISLNNKVEYDVLLKRNYGTLVQNIIDKGRFLQILKTQPINIKLSDWRNIAYHHTYEIITDNIKCNYGKKGDSFTLSLDELYNYCVQIIKSYNIVDIGRRIFLYDNSEFFSGEFDSHYINVRDRDVMRIGQLKTSMLSQGFKLIDIKVDDKFVEAIIWDIKRADLMNDEEKIKREIHCSQFLYNIWIEFPCSKISILYCNNIGSSLYQYSVEGQVCKAIADEKLEFSQMFAFLNIKKLGFDYLEGN